MKTRKSWKLRSSFAGAILLGALATMPAGAQSFPTLITNLGPIDYWRFNETTPSPAVNTISNYGSLGPWDGYAADGALTGQPGVVGNAVRLIDTSGADLDCITRIDIPNNPALNPPPPWSIEFWADPTTLSTDSTGLAVVSSDSPYPNFDSRSGYLVYLHQGTAANTAVWTLRTGGEASYNATAGSAQVPCPPGSWTHIVGTFDGTTASIYVNGVLSGSGPASVSQPFHVNQWVPTRIGGTSLNGGEYDQYGAGNRGYDGYLDEFAIYNTILSTNVIMQHYLVGSTNPPPSVYDPLILASSPVGYYNMDEAAYTTPDPSNTIAFDLGSFDDLGTNTLGAQAVQPGVPGLSVDAQSVFYNNVVGSLVLNTAVTPYDPVGLPLTLAAWVKPLTLGGGMAQDIIAQGYDENTSVENYLRICDTYDWEDGNGLPDIAYYDIGTTPATLGPGAGPYVSAIYPVPPGDVGHWVFIVGTYDTVAGQWDLYRNGTLVATQPDEGVGPSDSQLPWSVGSRSTPSPYMGFFFAGNIEEASIFTNTLDAATISNLYNSVALPPVITQAPQPPAEPYVGSLITFSVWADGPGTLGYQWYTNGAPLAGQTLTNLTLTLALSDSATYSVVVTNAYGSATSSVVLNVLPLPALTLAPSAETRWIGSPLSFAPTDLDSNEVFTFQWNLNGSPIPGANQSSYTATAASNTAGTYTLLISNSEVTLLSAGATLSVLTPPNDYVATVLSDHPLSYFRLDELTGTIGYDYAGGNDGNYYGSYELGQPGYSIVDTDTAVTFSGTVGSYLGDIGATTINFPGTASEFTIEAWANGAAASVAPDAPVIAKGTGGNGGLESEQFVIDVINGDYRFAVCDNKGDVASVTATTGPDGTWHYLVGVCDEIGGTMTLYEDANPVASGGFTALDSGKILSSSDPVSIGGERSGVLPAYDYDYAGTIDEVAIYPSALSQARISAHFAAVYGTNLAPIITNQPLSVTQYVTYPVTLSVSAFGSYPLTYTWTQAGVGVVQSGLANSFTIPSLSSANAGTYTVNVSNGAGSTNSAQAVVTVLPAPTTPPNIDGLVLHLTFDDTLVDATGRGNNGTNLASGVDTVITNSYVQGQIGDAFSYTTTLDTNGNASAQYATLGVRPDLQFGSNISFTVSMWVQEPLDTETFDVPFFTDAIDSTFDPGFVFAPSYGTSVEGSWGYSIENTAGTVAQGAYGVANTLDDGNWNHLVFVFDRDLSSMVVYTNGVVSSQDLQGAQTADYAIGNINVPNAATIGQDPTGTYNGGWAIFPVSYTFAIDDLGVWQRALTPLEVESIYLAGSINQVSFTGAGPTNSAPPPTPTIAVLPGNLLSLTWSVGTLQGTTNLAGTWTNVTGATSPYTNAPTGTQQFFRVEQ
jgi:Concanavalin A-like lectin/glucanases superfamily